MTKPVRGRNRGQAMLEFAVVLPVMLFVIMGFIDFGILMFDIGTTRYAASEAARAEAIVGATQDQTCDAACLRVFPANATCDADCRAIVAIHQTALGSTSLENVKEIDVQQWADDGTGTGTIKPVMSGTAGACTKSPPGVPTPCQNRYNFDGSCIGFCTDGSVNCSTGPKPSKNGSWPTACRNIQFGKQDYLLINIAYEYQWKTGIYAKLPFPQLNATFLVRLEPQSF